MSRAFLVLASTTCRRTASFRRGAMAGIAVVTLVVMVFAAGVVPAAATPPVPSRPGVVDSPTWHLRTTLSAGPDTLRFVYGVGGRDQPVMGDWNGDGTATVGVVRRAPDGVHLQWLLRNTNTGGTTQIGITYGLAENPSTPSAYDYPIVGDWDGNGTDTPGLVRVRPGSMTFLLRNSNSSGSANIAFIYGRTGFPVVGDWDGNGTDTPGVVRDNGLDLGNQLWFLRNSNTTGPADVWFVYGRGGDFPISGDWNADGRDTAGVVRFDAASRQARWLLRNRNTSGAAQLNFLYGPGDRPVVVWR